MSQVPTVASALADAFLALSADIVDDAERNRIANENRLRQLTRVGLDKDGRQRGFGLDEADPDVARLSALVDMLRKVEDAAVLQLNRKMRAHPLGWMTRPEKKGGIKGFGEKQVARLLATIGDPYWNTLHDRPRTVSELWAYCGYHTLPVDQKKTDAHLAVVGRKKKAAGGDQAQPDTQLVSVAARRVRGQRANWSVQAKTRTYLIAESCMKAGGPYREVYDKRKAATLGRVHKVPCVRCGPSGKPALPGSEWSPGHRHADALRITSKTILRDLWREARRLHELEENA